MAAGIIVAKVGVIAAVLLLPTHLALSLGVAHGLILLILLIAGGGGLLLHRHQRPRPRLHGRHGNRQ